jgi:hypothetical protein
MDPEVKRAWVAALREQDYRRGHGQLHKRTNDGADYFDSSGILCELAIKSGVPVTVHHDAVCGAKTYDNHMCYLPEQVVQWAGLRSCNPAVVFEGQHQHLTTLDDTPWLATREQIADAIDASL